MRRVWAYLGAAVIVVASAGCARGGEVDTGSENVPGQNTVGTEWVDGIPMYPQAEAISGRTEKQGAITQSFATDQVEPKRLMQWFERELARQGWEAVTKAHPIGRNAYRGDWIKDRDELRVTATKGPELEELRGVENATQFSLVLERD